MLLEAYNRDDCVKIWKAFPQLQTEDDFIELVKRTNGKDQKAAI